MKIGNLLQSRLMGKTMKALENALDFRAANHSVISGNLANIETPGYVPKKVTFNQALRDAVTSNDTPAIRKVSLHRTHSKHLPLSSDVNSVYSVDAMKLSELEGKKLNLDREMAKMSQNNLLYEASVQLLTRKFESLKTVIRGRT